MKITNETAAQKLKAIDDSKIFSVTFIKRTTGEIRHMLCQKGVKAHVKGEGRNYDPDDKNLLFVYDVEKARDVKKDWLEDHPNPSALDLAELEDQLSGCYRAVNLETIIRIKVDVQEYEVNNLPVVQWKFTWSPNPVAEYSVTVEARVEVEAKATFKRQQGLKRLPKGLKIECLAPKGLPHG